MNSIAFAIELALRAAAFERNIPMEVAYVVMERDIPGVRRPKVIGGELTVAELVVMCQILGVPTSEVLKAAETAHIAISESICKKYPDFKGEFTAGEAEEILSELKRNNPMPQFSVNKITTSQEYLKTCLVLLNDWLERK